MDKDRKRYMDNDYFPDHRYKLLAVTDEDD